MAKMTDRRKNEEVLRETRHGFGSTAVNAARAATAATQEAAVAADAAPDVPDDLPAVFEGDSNADRPDLYRVLGVPRDAKDDGIREAWRRLAAKLHPDRSGSAKAFEELGVAYATLSDPAARQKYDEFMKSDPKRFARFQILMPNRGYTGMRFGVHFQNGEGFINCPRIAAWHQGNGLKVIDRRPGEPGGMGDERLMSRYRVEVPEGRERSGRTFKDSKGLQFNAGVAYTNNPDILSHYVSELGYLVTDQGVWAPPPNDLRHAGPIEAVLPKRWH